MHSNLRQFQILALILSAWFMPIQVYSYRGASVNTNGGANADWRVEADSSSYESRRQNARRRFGDRRQMLEEGIERHRRGVDSGANNAQQLAKRPPIELDPVQGMINDLRNDKPIILGFDKGDRMLAADLNILPQSMAPRTPGRHNEEIKIMDPKAKTGVLVILPDNLPGPTAVLTKLALETSRGVECLIFQPDSCEFDPLSPNPQLTIPENAIPFTIPGPGKHEVELPEGLEINPALPATIVFSLLNDITESEIYTGLLQQVEDAQKPLIHQGRGRETRDILSNLYYSNYQVTSTNYHQQLPLIKQQLSVIPSMHMTFRYLDFTGGYLHLVEDAGEEHFYALDRENTIFRSAGVVRGRVTIANALVRNRREEFESGNYELGVMGH